MMNELLNLFHSFGDFQTFCRSRKNKTFISKPESGCQGKGIFVFKNPKEIKPGEHCVVQQYIAKVGLPSQVCKDNMFMNIFLL